MRRRATTSATTATPATSASTTATSATTATGLRDRRRGRLQRLDDGCDHRGVHDRAVGDRCPNAGRPLRRGRRYRRHLRLRGRWLLVHLRHVEHALPLRPGSRLVDDAGTSADSADHAVGRLLPADERSLRLRRLGPGQRRGHQRGGRLRRRERHVEHGPGDAGSARLHVFRLQPRQRQDLPRRRVQHGQHLARA